MCKRFRIVILNILIVLHVRTTLSAELQFDVLKKQRIIEKRSQGIMAPKMDYDEWTPLGRGDPLKNDPTFDYSPPMVSKVKYWINPLLRTPDPPIRPNKDYSTEANMHTATMTSSIKSNFNKQSDIKRFYVDFKDSPSDVAYVQSLVSKYNKSNRLQPFQYQNQNHFYSPTRQLPAPLPMLVPPPPVEPHDYSSTKMENSTTIEFSWDMKDHESTTPSSSSSAPMSAHNLLFPVSKPFVDPKPTSDKSVLQSLLGKEKSSAIPALHLANPTNPTTAHPLTPNPVPFTLKQNTIAPKPPTYLIIQGHSKVKKYGGASKLERSDTFQDTNDIMKYELPKDVSRSGKHINLEDFLPFKETSKDVVNEQTEGSGFVAELTKAIFPSFFEPSTTLVYESPRMYDYIEDNEEQGENLENEP